MTKQHFSNIGMMKPAVVQATTTKITQFTEAIMKKSVLTVIFIAVACCILSAQQFAFYSQTGQSWSDDTMGGTPFIMEDYGCAVCGISMLLTQESTVSGAVTPGTLNTYIGSVNGYDSQANLTSWSLPANQDGTVGLQYYGYNIAINNWSYIDQQLAAGRVCLVKVDAIPSSYSIQEHWVVCYQKVGPSGQPSSYLINDPLPENYTPRTLAYYYDSNTGNTTFKAVVYSGNFNSNGGTGGINIASGQPLSITSSKINTSPIFIPNEYSGTPNDSDMNLLLNVAITNTSTATINLANWGVVVRTSSGTDCFYSNWFSSDGNLSISPGQTLVLNRKCYLTEAWMVNNSPTPFAAQVTYRPLGGSWTPVSGTAAQTSFTVNPRLPLANGMLVKAPNSNAIWYCQNAKWHLSSETAANALFPNWQNLYWVYATAEINVLTLPQAPYHNSTVPVMVGHNFVYKDPASPNIWIIEPESGTTTPLVRRRFSSEAAFETYYGAGVLTTLPVQLSSSQYSWVTNQWAQGSIIDVTSGDGNDTGATATLIQVPHNSTYEINPQMTDVDWYRIQLSAGTPYRLYNTSSTTFDSRFHLYGPNNYTSLIDEDDDSADALGYILQPLLDYTPSTSGYYYLRVAYYANTPHNSLIKAAKTTPTRNGDYTLHIVAISNPTLSANPSVLNFGNQNLETPSAPQSYQLTGSSLTSGVSVAASAGFYLASSQTGTYLPSLSLTPSGGTINQSVWVKFIPSQSVAYSSSITNTSGSVSASVQVSGTGTLPNTMPAAPTGLSAVSQGSSSIMLSWMDNSSNEQGFKIQRRTTGGNWVQMALTAADFVSFTDNELQQGTAYFYRVFAFNSTGDSGYSNEATATTPTSYSGALLNPSFEDSVNGWSFQNSTANTADFSVSTNYAMDGQHSGMVIIGPGVPAESWQMELSQLISVEAGIDYHFSFWIKSTQTITIGVNLINDQSPWNSYGLWSQKTISSTWKKVEINFTCLQPDDTAMLVWQLGSAVNTTVYLDMVVFEQLPQPIPDNGSLLANGSFEGNYYPFTIADLSENTMADFYTVDDTSSHGDWSLHVNPNQAHTQVWHLQVYQTVQTVANQRYLMTFSAKAQTPREVNAELHNNVYPYQNFGLYTTTSLGTTWSTYEFTFVATQSGEARCVLMLGSSATPLWLDAIQLAPVLSIEDTHEANLESLSCYPSPCKDNLSVSYELGADARCKVDIFNLRGQHVITLADDNRKAGRYIITWSGKDKSGISVAPGIYMVRVATRNKMLQKKIIVSHK